MKITTGNHDFDFVSSAFEQRDSSDSSISKRLKALAKAKFEPLVSLLKEFLSSQDSFWIEMGIKNLIFFKDSITQNEIQMIRNALDTDEDADVQMAAASFLGFNDPNASEFLMNKIDENNDKFVNAAIAASVLTSNNIPPYISLAISDQITSGNIKNAKLNIQEAIKETILSSK